MQKNTARGIVAWIYSGRWEGKPRADDEWEKKHCALL